LSTDRIRVIPHYAEGTILHRSGIMAHATFYGMVGAVKVGAVKHCCADVRDVTSLAGATTNPILTATDDDP
jgi:hypothetical protein